ncbi:hypothetical protein [Corallococcus sp. RDP092CA]|uniref:hypothetical protein n=1 Tax=Corallococcus sp. RDP092CA TaxID=3109369 RepID=UPI0035B21F8E
MPLAPRSRLLSSPSSIPVTLKLALRTGVRSDDIIPLLLLAEHSPSRLQVKLFEGMRPIDWGILGTIIAAAILFAATLALPSPLLLVLASGGLILATVGAFLYAYTFRLRNILTRRAREFVRQSATAPEAPGIDTHNILKRTG